MRLANIIAGLFAVGVIAALLVIAVRRARYAAREMQSSNNLKQLSLAVLNYESAHRCLPSGCDNSDLHGWSVRIQPYVEASSLYTRIRKDISWDDRFNAYHFRQTLSYYLNPNVSPKWTRSGFGLSHYTANPTLIHRGSKTKMQSKKSSGAIWCFP